MNKLSIAVKYIILVIGMVGTAGIAYADNNIFSNHSLLNLNSWTGYYAGVNAGLTSNNSKLRSHHLGFLNPSGNCNASSDFSTFLSGIQLGYMYQLPNDFVSGLEANVTVNTHQKNKLTCRSLFNPNLYDRFWFKNEVQTSIKGRFGHTINWHEKILLAYLTAGVSFANLGLSYKNEGGDHYSTNNTRSGWLIGAGLEWAYKKNWSLRAEYSYGYYENAIKMQLPIVYGLVDPNGRSHVNLNSNNFVVAINYWV